METSIEGSKNGASRCETGEPNSTLRWRALHPVGDGEQSKDFKQKIETRQSLCLRTNFLKVMWKKDLRV